MSLIAIAAVALLQVPPPAEVAVGDLLNLTAAEAALRLGGREPPQGTALTLIDGAQEVTVYPGSGLYPPVPEGQACITRLLAPGEEGEQPLSAAIFPPPHRAQIRAWVFESGRLTAVRVARPRSAPPPATSRRAFQEWAIQQGARNGWTAEPGRLPLSAGLPMDDLPGFAAESDRIVTACRPLPSRRAAGRSTTPGWFRAWRSCRSPSPCRPSTPSGTGRRARVRS